MSESFVGAKIIGSLFVIVGILLIAVGVSSIVSLTILGTLPPEIISALSSISGNAYMLIVYGLIAIGLAVGLFQEEEWAAGGAGILLVIILVSTGFNIYSLYETLGLTGLYSSILAFNVPFIITIGTFIVALVSLIYLIAAKGWR
ncbi:MAG: hypothetical protein ACTSSJ_00050 [Candidatus Odinarchaeia archaeon]